MCLLPPRVHELEEQVRDAETKADQVLEEEAKRHREAYHKIERDRNLEIDLLCNRYGPQQETGGGGLKFIPRWNGWIKLTCLFTQTAAAGRGERNDEDKRVQTQVPD